MCVCVSARVSVCALAGDWCSVLALCRAGLRFACGPLGGTRMWFERPRRRS